MSKFVVGKYHLPYNPNLKEKARELRNNMTETERIVWKHCLQKFRIPVLRQRPIDNYIVDFYIASHKLVIEIDGVQHSTESGKEYDENRTNILAGYGLTVLRFTNADVLSNLQSVCSVISHTITNEIIT
ncbi:MAG: endonuclease domain-containing protein [Candidatus Kapaibacterium sp.]|nr:endonuclease domain-containing protein [Bacteroidota bacterium]